LAIYYGEEKHRSELRIALVPGSYVPRFTLPGLARSPVESEFVSETAAFPTHTVGKVAFPALTLPKADSLQLPPSVRRRAFRVGFAIATLGLVVALAMFPMDPLSPLPPDSTETLPCPSSARPGPLPCLSPTR
jgi:hypothetical protein